MAAPKVYRWDDGNAPVLCGTRTSLIALLKACLVDGYGSKSPAGWTMPYINSPTNNRAAFRNNPATGTGFFLQVDAGTSSADNMVKLQGFETMTSYSSGLTRFIPTVAETITSNSADTTARPWILIADDRAFWLVIFSNDTTTPGVDYVFASSLFFGDFVKNLATDGSACAINVTGGAAYGSYGYLYDSTVGNQQNYGFFCPRKRNGTVGQWGLAVVKNGGPGGSMFGQNGEPYTVGGQLLIMRPYLNNAEEYTFRGYMPGLYIPCHNLQFGQFETVTVDGKNLLSLRHYGGGGYNINYFLSLDDWRV